MALVIHGTSCCAVKEIHQLDEYVGKAEQAMLDFCKQRLYYNNTLNKAGAFIIFTSVERCIDREARGEMKFPVKYGSEFAKLIKAKKLGTLVSTRAAANTSNHPNHFVKVWAWHPDWDALTAWYKDNRPTTGKKRVYSV